MEWALTPIGQCKLSSHYPSRKPLLRNWKPLWVASEVHKELLWLLELARTLNVRPGGLNRAEWVWRMLILSGRESREPYNVCSEGRGKHLRHTASSRYKDNFTVIRPKLEARCVPWKCLQVTNLLDRCQSRKAVFSKRGWRLVFVSGSNRGLELPSGLWTGPSEKTNAGGGVITSF